MADLIIRSSGGSVIQHGSFNDRVYLMKIAGGDLPAIIEQSADLAANNGYGKIFARVPGSMAPLFIAAHYNCEAIIPEFIRGNEDLFYMSRFLSEERRKISAKEREMLGEISHLLKQGEAESIRKDSIDKVVPVEAGKDEAAAIASLFGEVFETYPFPIDTPSYIEQCIDDGTRFFVVRDRGSGDLIAVSSAEVDRDSLSAEMTDFAVSPSHRGKGLSLRLLDAMENVMRREGIVTLYTIARLNSIPMNRCFLRLGYSYAGTAVNNTNIGGRIESMNILYKRVIR